MLVNLAALVDRSTDSWVNERAARIYTKYVSIILVFPTERCKNNKLRLRHWLREGLFMNMPICRVQVPFRGFSEGGGGEKQTAEPRQEY